MIDELKQARGTRQAVLESPNTSSLMKDVIQNFLNRVQIND